VLNVNHPWDVVTVRGKITIKKETTTVGSKRLNLSEAVLADDTASMPLDLLEDNIHKVTEGQVYSLSNLQLRLWSGKKKLSTTARTIVTTITDNAELSAIPQDTNEDETEYKDAMIEEFVSIQKFEKFHKCMKCNKKIAQVACSKVVRCTRCGVIRADKCQVGMTTKLSVKTDDNIELSLTFGDKVLNKLLAHDVLEMEEDTMAEELLFINNVALTYNANTFLVKDIK
jgi:hypothetical protein